MGDLFSQQHFGNSYTDLVAFMFLVAIVLLNVVLIQTVGLIALTKKWIKRRL